MGGQIFFADRYYGYDDAPYAAVRLIEAAETLGRNVTELRGAMAPMVNTPELRFQVDESRKFAIVDEVLARLAASGAKVDRSEEHTSELQSLMRISYAVFCLKHKNYNKQMSDS